MQRGKGTVVLSIKKNESFLLTERGQVFKRLIQPAPTIGGDKETLRHNIELSEIPHAVYCTKTVQELVYRHISNKSKTAFSSASPSSLLTETHFPVWKQLYLPTAQGFSGDLYF